jgi:hypothetical protein
LITRIAARLSRLISRLERQEATKLVSGRCADILAAAPKLGATELEVEELLRRSGFFKP